MNEMIKDWLKRCKEKGLRFTFLRTRSAIFDRVVVVKEKAFSLLIAYPKMHKGKWRIINEEVAISSIIHGKYYQS